LGAQVTPAPFFMIPIYEPWVATNQKEYVNKCLETNWISSRGEFVERFEEDLAKYLNVKHVLTVSNGTVSLQLILAALGIGADDDVLVPEVTYAACFSAIHWSGARIVPIPPDDNGQCLSNHYNLKRFLTPKTKALLLPHLYGNCADVEKIKDFCKLNRIYLIEDAAEAFGSNINGKKLGTFGEAGSFSFFSNKIITTGEGGAVVTNNTTLYERMKLMRSQSHVSDFYHPMPGFNFRMTNIQAAIGCAQLEDVDTIISRKKAIADLYRQSLKGYVNYFENNCDSSEWMPLFIHERYPYSLIKKQLNAEGVDTRPCFRPIRSMCSTDNFIEWNVCKKFDHHNPFIESCALRAFNLPCYPSISNTDLMKIIEKVRDI
jgi:perosamine synthetase